MWSEHSRAQTADEALAVRMGTRGTYRGAHDLNFGGYVGEVCAIFPVIVADQVDGGLANRCGFPYLLGDPGIGG